MRGSAIDKTKPEFPILFKVKKPIKPHKDRLMDVMEMAQRYICTVCGYIYDPDVGDPGSEVKPGTPFEELPDGWVCPSCGATKDQFEEVK